MTIKNPREYDIVGITGSRVGTLVKVTPKYFMDTSGVKYLRDYVGGAYSIVKKGSIQQAAGKGWKEAADHTGKAPRHKAAATRNNLSGTSRIPLQKEVPVQKKEQQPWRPFREDYEIGEHQGRATVQRIGTGGAQTFATFDNKQQAQNFLNSCPSKKEQQAVPIAMDNLQEVAQRAIDTAPNIEWKRKYKIVLVRNISVSDVSQSRTYHGRFILLEFKEQSQKSPNFVGVSIIDVPELYIDESHPVHLYTFGETVENKAERLYNDAVGLVKHHILYNKCSTCGSYRPPKVTERQGGRELVYVTSTCQDCGHKEVEPFD